jgi:DNA-binding HxlR family transcriptional regulator
MSDCPQTAQEGTFLKPEHTKLTRHTKVTEPVDASGRARFPVLPPNAHLESDCRGPASILARVGDKWSVFVIMLLGGGPRRFNEIKRMVGGISQRMLTLTLRGLERDGLVTRTVFPTIPPRVDYELTDLGRGLWTPVEALGMWAREHQTEIEDARARFDRRNDAG